jgi:hypothetical protein
VARTLPLLAALMLIILLAVPSGAQAASLDGRATIAPGGHLVLVNFSVPSTPVDGDFGEAGSLRYLVFLDDGSEQNSFDVLLMTWDSYLSYREGEPFQAVAGASFLNAGDAPPHGYEIFLDRGDYVLLVDNSDAGTAPSSPAELKVRYDLDTDKLSVHRESRWDLFIGMMVIIVLIGVSFLIMLRILTRHRLARAEEDLLKRCPECGGKMPDYGSYCPNCGRER